AIISCNLGGLPNGGAATLHLVVTTKLPGLAINQASATADDFDPNPLDNFSSVLTPVSGTSPPELMSGLSLPAQDIAFDPTRNYILAALRDSDNRVVAYKLETGMFEEPIHLGAAASRLAIAENGEYLYVAQATGGVGRI